MSEEKVRIRRGRGPNKPKVPLGRDTPARAFARGTPIDKNTQLPPGEEIEIDRETAAHIPMDVESSRVAAQHHEVMTRKARGESGVKWNADDRIRYRECAQFHPNARVSFKDMTNGFNAIQSTYVAACKDYDELIAHLRKNVWKGDRVTFKWTIEDDSQPQWATGLIKFDAKEENMGQGQQPPPGYGPPQWGAPPQQPQWGVPGYFNGQYWDGRSWGPPQAAPPPPPPPPTAQAAPPAGPVAPPAPSMSMSTSPDPNTAYLHDEIRRLYSELDRRSQMVAGPPPPPPMQAQQMTPPGWYGNPPKWWDGHTWHQSPPAQEPVAAVAQPDRPLTPIESARSAVQTVLDLSRLSNELKSSLTDPKVEDPETEAPKTEDDLFPMMIKDFGPYRMSAIREGDGPPKLVEGMLPFAMLNLDKGAAAAKGFLQQVGEFMDMRLKQGTQANEQQQQAQRRAVENAERLAAAQKTIAEAEAQAAQAAALRAAALQAQRQIEATPVAPPAPSVVAAPPPPAPVVEPALVTEPPKDEVEDFVNRVMQEPETEPAPPLSMSFATPKANGSASVEVEDVVPTGEPEAPVLREN